MRLGTGSDRASAVPNLRPFSTSEVRHGTCGQTCYTWSRDTHAMQHLSIRLPLDFVRWIDARAKAARVPRSIVIREVLLQAMQADAAVR